MRSHARCLVIGGTGSIGSEVCRRLTEENAELVFTYYQNKAKAEQLQSELSLAAALYCDIADFIQARKVVKDAAEILGGLDVLIQCAGQSGDEIFYSDLASKYAHTELISQNNIDDLYQVNARGSFSVCQAGYDIMRKTGDGNIVVLGSLDGVKPVPSPVHVAMSKAALKGMVESMAKELGKDNIRINLIAPGIVEGGASKIVKDSVRDTYVKHCSLSRLADPLEIAEMAVWLGLENTYITGQSILLDGGL